MSEHTPTPIEIPMRGFHPPPPEERSGAVSIKRLTIPVVMLVSVLGVAFIVGATWNTIEGHTKDSIIHVEEKRAVEGGGVAFQKDLREVQRELGAKIDDQAKKHRRALRNMKLNCKRREDGLYCRTELPEDGE